MQPAVEIVEVGLYGRAFLEVEQLSPTEGSPERWATRDDLRIAILTWIDRTYQRRRPQDTLGRLTPIEYEAIVPHPPDRQPNPTCHLSVRQTHIW